MDGSRQVLVGRIRMSGCGPSQRSHSARWRSLRSRHRGEAADPGPLIRRALLDIMENSRLLLWSNQRSNGGVVPNATALGRYWMEHPTFEGGNAILADYGEFEVDAVNEAFFSPTLAAMERLQIMNFGIRLIETPSGVKGLIADLACTAPDMAEWMASKLSRNLRCAAQLYVAWEQAPLASNQIELSKTDVDHAGVPRIELHWKKSTWNAAPFWKGSDCSALR